MRVNPLNESPAADAIRRVVDRPPGDGIVADWTELPLATKPFRAGWAFYDDGFDRSVSGHGGMSAHWIYRSKTRPDDQISIRITVYSTGQENALNLLMAETSSTMFPNPFGPAPPPFQLGDIAIMPFPDEIAGGSPVRQVKWVYCNVFVRMDTSLSPKTKFDIMPIARAIQAFMEKHVVHDLPARLPQVRDLIIQPQTVRVGETFRAKLVPGGSSTVGWYTSFQHLEGSLHSKHDELLEAEYVAEGPGPAVMEAHVMDQKTLLFRRLTRSFDVLPAGQ